MDAIHGMVEKSDNEFLKFLITRVQQEVHRDSTYEKSITKDTMLRDKIQAETKRLLSEQ